MTLVNRLADLFLTVLADTLRDLKGLADEIRSDARGRRVGVGFRRDRPESVRRAKSVSRTSAPVGSAWGRRTGGR